ncbi:type II toxin-antitoxin system VapC family toxin [Pararhizobium sp. DWP1-1-3]|uniref:type II toxin-antitoxin system VapC family toxin n=1 Tax=Pararhizobium sp. DWP1-1-3 TaxID=2804652 RepID=UPI003CF46F42
MSGYLLDTNVISKFAPDKPAPSVALIAWMREQGAEGRLFLSAMTIAEIEKGIRNLERRGASEKSARLRQWLEGIVSSFDDCILPMDIAVARVAGAIEDEADGRGRHPGLGDVIIAATAKLHGLTVVTENVRHFEPLDVMVELPDNLSFVE